MKKGVIENMTDKDYMETSRSRLTQVRVLMVSLNHGIVTVVFNTEENHFRIVDVVYPLDNRIKDKGRET